MNQTSFRGHTVIGHNVRNFVTTATWSYKFVCRSYVIQYWVSDNAEIIDIDMQATPFDMTEVINEH